MNKISLLVLFVLSSSILFSQEKKDTSNFILNPQFRSVQADISTILFVSKIGASIDFDLYSASNKTKEWNAFGIRLGVDRIYKTNAVEPYSSSPFTHINGLVRFSVEGKIIRVDTYAGRAYQFVSKTSEKKEKVYLKAGLDFKVKLLPYLGAIFNTTLCGGESQIGIGFYLT